MNFPKTPQSCCGEVIHTDPFFLLNLGRLYDYFHIVEENIGPNKITFNIKLIQLVTLENYAMESHKKRQEIINLLFFAFFFF